MAFLILFGIPALVAMGFLIFGKHRITLWEFLAQLGAQAIVAGISIGIAYYANTHDTEVWNAKVVSKAREEGPCVHAYPCNCRMVSCGKDCEYLHCDICFMHSYDVSWYVRNNIGERFTISTVDMQGLIEPKRWTVVEKDDPTSTTHGYTNYIKAAPGTLFKRESEFEKFAATLPAYPLDTYDYYHLNRVIPVGVNLPDLNHWNGHLMVMNSNLGPAKKVNVVVVVVVNQPPEWFHALEAKWVGGKKNDVIPVIGVNPDLTIRWVDVMAWVKSAMVKVTIRDDLLALGKLDRLPVMDIIGRNIVQHYVRQPMSEFEYLKASITPSPTAWIISLLVGMLVAVGLGIFFYLHETFTPEDDPDRGNRPLYGRSRL